MIQVEVRGREIEVIEISDQWGEESRVFQSRAELRNWVDERFAPEQYKGPEEERLEIIERFYHV